MRGRSGRKGRDVYRRKRRAQKRWFLRTYGGAIKTIRAASRLRRAAYAAAHVLRMRGDIEGAREAAAEARSYEKLAAGFRAAIRIYKDATGEGRF